jgi:histidyl-tRNA synthetase
VRKELVERGIGPEVVARMMDLIVGQEPGLGSLDLLQEAMGDIPAGAAGIRELRELAAHLDALYISQDDYAIDFTMVRGLGYYTGPIYETIIEKPNLGSVSGGGRYDELLGMFRKESLPMTGTSLGIERLIDLMDVLDLYPDHIVGTVVQVFVTVFDESTRSESTRLAAELRAAGIRTELHLEDRRLGKQFQHADRKGIPLVATLGPDEIAQGKVTIKRLHDGEEVSIGRGEAIAEARRLLGG